VIDGRTECYYRAKTIQNHLKLKKKLNIFENIQSRFDKIRNSKFTKCLKKIRNEFHSKIFVFHFENFEFRTPLVIRLISRMLWS
jgi:hypothetical protein